MKSGRYRVASGAQCVAVEITEEKSTLYSPLQLYFIAPRHCRGSTASTASTALYISTALHPLHSTTLYNAPLMRLCMGVGEGGTTITN